jgi:hypothetical protein
MKKTLLFAAIALFLGSNINAQNFESFGKDFIKTTPKPATDLKKLDLTQKKAIEVEGEVSAVCQAAGCWMTINLDNGETMRVTFKDYGFFVPKNLAGTKVVFKGIPEVTETSVSDLRHYAADAGKSQEEILKIMEPEITLTFVADGVLVPSK